MRRNVPIDHTGACDSSAAMPMSTNLIAAQHVVSGFDRRRLRRPRLPSTATVFNSADEAVAAADVVITMVPDGEVAKRCDAEV